MSLARKVFQAISKTVWTTTYLTYWGGCFFRLGTPIPFLQVRDLYNKYNKHPTWTQRQITCSSCQVECHVYLYSSLIRYQVLNALQAFCNSLTGLLSSRAILQGEFYQLPINGVSTVWLISNLGFGVGDPSATPTQAMLLTVVQDVFGRLTSKRSLSTPSHV